jgi:hypothetical protein
MVKILLCILGLGWCLQVSAADFKLYAAAGVQ